MHSRLFFPLASGILLGTFNEKDIEKDIIKFSKSNFYLSPEA